MKNYCTNELNYSIIVIDNYERIIKCMKIEQLSMNEVKVVLSHEEMESMNVDPNKFFSDSSLLRSFILNILQEIHRQTDFNPFHGNIKMEAMPEDDNGMSILLSKHGDVPYHVDTEKECIGVARAIVCAPSRVKPKRKIRSVKAVKADNKRKGVMSFVFNEFDDLCGAVSRINDETAIELELYKLNNVYVLLVPIMTKSLDNIAMIMEFASDVKRDLTYEHIREHGTCIAKGNKMRSMAEGIKNLNKI